MRFVSVACGLVVGAVLLAGCGTGAPQTTSRAPTTVSKPPRQKPDDSLPWPTYGGDSARTRAVSAPGLRPPFRRVWTFYSGALLELPPVAGYGLLYEESFDGRIDALDPATGAERWGYESHFCGWSSPTLGDGLVFATFIGDSHCSRLQGGKVVALSARTGRVRWARRIGRSESSPLYANGTVYFGDTSGRVHAVDAVTGAERWTYETGAPVKASPTLAGGRLFVGNYAGDFYALDAASGKAVWRDRGYGNIYSSAAVADGRVYVGSTDGHVYAFAARSGQELWRFATGRYVYASAAVWRGLVLIGSYDDTFYAIDGATGAERWRFHAGGAISGGASVIDGVVYFSTFTRKTFALSASNGRLLERWNDGEYSPAVAAYGRLFLIGFAHIYALKPR
jgi:outer membrane protein assembly factor BamB